MNKTSIFIVIAAIAAIIGRPKLCAAADAGKPPVLQWSCGPNARIEGNLLIVDVPVGEEKTGKIYDGVITTVDATIEGEFDRIMTWADKFRKLHVRTNAAAQAALRG